MLQICVSYSLVFVFRGQRGCVVVVVMLGSLVRSILSEFPTTIRVTMNDKKC
jgi:hypothetical protein